MPDQTYDTWRMEGASAYRGSLWLAALKAAEATAQELGDTDFQVRYAQWLSVAQASLERLLWNGAYYDHDTQSAHRLHAPASSGPCSSR